MTGRKRQDGTKTLDIGTKMVPYPPMRLADYLKTHKISDAAFARSIGVERQAVGRYRSGDRFPEKEILLRIFSETNGEVTANDFAGISSSELPRAEVSS